VDVHPSVTDAWEQHGGKDRIAIELLASVLSGSYTPARAFSLPTPILQGFELMMDATQVPRSSRNISGRKE
jgi:hypothetical protein